MFRIFPQNRPPEQDGDGDDDDDNDDDIYSNMSDFGQFFGPALSTKEGTTLIGQAVKSVGKKFIFSKLQNCVKVASY